MKLAALSFSLSLLCLVEGFAMSDPAGGSIRPAARRPAGPTAGGAAQPKPQPQPDYAETQGGHYKVHVERATWREAQAACEAEGAHLVVLDSKKEAGAVRELIARQPANVTNELHAGFFRPDYFVTTFGVPLSIVGYQKWAPEQQHTQTCGTINHAVLMYDSKCADKRSFICEHKKETSSFKLADPLPILTEHQGEKPIKEYKPITEQNQNVGYEGLVQQGRLHYYKVSTTKLRWSEAQRFCEEDGAYLFVLNHQYEADVLKEHLKKFPGLSDELYVGFHNGDNKFITVFGPTPGYRVWESEQPDDETCLTVDHNMLLKKIPCWEKREFICEMTVA